MEVVVGADRTLVWQDKIDARVRDGRRVDERRKSQVAPATVRPGC